MSEKQIPQIVGNIEKGQQGMELLERGRVRPRQARYQAALRPDMKCFVHSKVLSNFTPILAEIVSSVGREAFQALHPQYAQGDYFSTTIAQLVSYLSEFRKSMEWNEALDELEGANAVPIMTIHKSKGFGVSHSRFHRL